MKALILAGGFATRLWPITEDRAKPLLLVNGKTILHHLIDQLGDFPSEDIIVLTNQKFEKDFRLELTKIGAEKSHIFIEDAENEGAKLGALRAVAECIKHFNITEDIAILAGDNILTGFDIRHLDIESNQAKIVVRSVPTLEDARKFGVLQTDKNNVVIDFEEKPSHPKSTLVSTGFMSIGSDLFDILTAFTNDQPDNLGGIFAHLLDQKAHPKPNHTILAHQSDGAWFDIGSFETYLESHIELQTKPLITGRNTQQNNNIFSGKVCLSSESLIENCTIIDSIIYPGVTLKNCVISRCVIGENTHLEGIDLNHKIIRRNTKLKA